MFIEIGGAVRCRWVPATVAVLAGATVLAGTVPAAASQVSRVDCSANRDALQPAINGAAPGETLLVTGLCTGPFTISKNLTLDGGGPAVLNGKDTGRTVTVGSTAEVHLRGLIIIGGRGGINNEGTLTVSDSVVTGNTTYGPGGGINNAEKATLVVTGSEVRHNTSFGAGGGISNNGSLTMRDSDVYGNSADNCGGIDSVGTGITAVVIDSSLYDNDARIADGGGICEGQSTLALVDSEVRENTAKFGAGIYNRAGTVSLTRSRVLRNTASGRGGGIINVNDGAVNVTRSAVTDNTAAGGPGSGGGIYNADGAVRLNDSQVTRNTPDDCGPPGSVPGCTGRTAGRCRRACSRGIRWCGSPAGRRTHSPIGVAVGR